MGETAKMFHPGFVIHDQVVVAFDQTIQQAAQKVVGGAVAAGPLRTPHGDEIEAVTFHQGLLHLQLHVDVLGHAHRDIGLHLFARVPEGFVEGHPEHFVQVGIGIGVHRQYRLHPMINQVADQQPSHGGFPGAALAAHSHSQTHGNTSQMVFKSAGRILFGCLGSVNHPSHNSDIRYQSGPVTRQGRHLPTVGRIATKGSYTGLGSDVALSKAGKMPALPDRHSRMLLAGMTG